MFCISSTILLSCCSISAFDSSLRSIHLLPNISPFILSIAMYVRPLQVKAQYTFGTGIEVF